MLSIGGSCHGGEPVCVCWLSRWSFMGGQTKKIKTSKKTKQGEENNKKPEIYKGDKAKNELLVRGGRKKRVLI